MDKAEKKTAQGKPAKLGDLEEVDLI